MADTEILSETPIGMNELKKELASIKKRDKELNFRAAKAEEYLQSFTLSDKSDELLKQLNALKIPRLKEQHIVKIIDIIPHSVEELKGILQGYTVTVNNDNIKKIIDTINKFTAEK